MICWEQAEQPGPRSFFTELLSSMSDLKFSRDGRYMLARDFMTLKLWDVNMESSPVATYPIHEHLKPRVCTACFLQCTCTFNVHVMSILVKLESPYPLVPALLPDPSQEVQCCCRSTVIWVGRANLFTCSAFSP